MTTYLRINPTTCILGALVIEDVPSDVLDYIESLDSDLASVQREAHDLYEEVVMLQGEMAARWEAAQTAEEDKIEDLSASEERLTEENQRLKADLDRVSAGFKNISDALFNANQERSLLLSELDGLKDELAALQEQVEHVDRMKGLLDGEEGTVKSLRKANSTLTLQIEGLQAQLTQERRDYGAMRVEYDGMKFKISEIKRMLDETAVYSREEIMEVLG